MTGPGEPLPELLAAVDLGSNSFHLMVVRYVDGELQQVDRLRERVRLAAGLDEDGKLTREAQARALACLERMGQRLQGLPRGAVRAVGTNTLRKARNSLTFLVRARRALGHPIEVISGQEEARLIYLGVARTLAPGDDERRLVVDIGGGSTECIIGQGASPLSKDSMYMGCVSYSQRYFGEGEITAAAMRRAMLAARLELEPVVARTRSLDWVEAVGASGTIKAVDRILEVTGWSPHDITAEGLVRLREELVRQGRVEALSLPGLAEDRIPVICGGVAVLSAIFEAFEIERMSVSQGALREGVLYDLIGRLEDHDARDRTVAALQSRWRVDRSQARRVADTAEGLFAQVREAWGLPAIGARMLRWAAMLHELGLQIGYSGYHKHGAYVLEHGDLPGFSRPDQVLLAGLVGNHRRRLRVERFASLNERRQVVGRRLCVLLRVAVRLHRSRAGFVPPMPRAVVAEGVAGLALRFPEGWLDEHPLTLGDLERERDYLEEVGLALELS